MAVIQLTPKSPWEIIVEGINTENASTGAKFTLSDLTWVVKNTNNTAGTAVAVVSPGPGTPYFNSQEIAYNRLNLAHWFRNVAVRVYTDTSISYGDVIKELSKRYCMVTGKDEYFLDPVADFESADMVKQVWFNTGGIQIINVTAKAGSLAWYGTIAINVYNRTLDIATYLKNTDLGTLGYVDDGNGSKTSARMVTYPVDFSTVGAALSSIPVGSTLPSDLVSAIVGIITNATGVSTQITTDLATGLQNNPITYNNKSSDSVDKGVNTSFNRVVVIPIGQLTTVYGSVVLGYTI